MGPKKSPTYSISVRIAYSFDVLGFTGLLEISWILEARTMDFPNS